MTKTKEPHVLILDKKDWLLPEDGRGNGDGNDVSLWRVYGCGYGSGCGDGFGIGDGCGLVSLEVLDLF